MYSVSIFSVFQYIAWLAFQHLTDGFQRGEADGFGFARLQDGEVGLRNAYLLCQLLRRHLPLGHHHIYINYYTHNLLSFPLDGQILFLLQILAHKDNLRDNHQGEAKNQEGDVTDDGEVYLVTRQQEIPFHYE